MASSEKKGWLFVDFNAPEFGHFLRENRKKIDLTLVELSAKSGVSQSYLSQLETGKGGRPSPEILGKIADHYGVAYGKLMLQAGYVEGMHEEIDVNTIESIRGELAVVLDRMSASRQLFPNLKEFVDNQLAENGISDVTADNYLEKTEKAIKELEEKLGTEEYQKTLRKYIPLFAPLHQLFFMAVKPTELMAAFKHRTLDIAHANVVYFEGEALTKDEMHAVQSFLTALRGSKK